MKKSSNPPLPAGSILFLLVAITLAGCADHNKSVYTEDWESLARHNEQPDWFQNAKFGIYFHWGVYSVPAFASEWYPRLMFIEGHIAQKHHLEKYGHPSEFGYHDFVPMFKAEHFNPEEWADLFVKAGARFAGPVAEHHDGFSMWASKQTPWNAGDKGPKRDITGELAKAFRARDLKLITTFHHARNLQRYRDRVEEELGIENKLHQFGKSHYPFIEGFPTTSDDPELAQLYGNLPEQQWLDQMWFGKLKEVVDKYQPDIVWFDSWLDEIPESYRKKFCAYFLNQAAKWGKEVVIVRKQDDLPLDVSVDDLEKSRKNRLEEKSWMTDETVSTGSWCYTENLKIKPANDVLHVLIDIVSKNGVLLLNISPKADGTIPQDQKDVLLAIGDWLGKYGEAIYSTRPWYTFGEGPTKEPEGHFKYHQEFLKIKYTEKDIRYTTKGNAIYASFLGTPAAGTVTLKSFAAGQMPEKINVGKVTLAGADTELDFELDDSGLNVTIPAAELDKMAVVLKIEKK
ncbi:alpha-L-fucosidase [candidate division KSB1 bacterium]|nr:alpha-L-fucosidase [candidate division KSB1 bacterium]